MASRERKNALDDEFLPIERRILRLSASDQRGFLVLRLILAAALGAQAWRRAPWAEAIPGIYAAAAIAIYALRRRLSETVDSATLLLDVAAALSVLWLVAGTSGPVYAALLLLILSATLLRRPIWVFAVGIAVCLAYAFLAFPPTADIGRALPVHMTLFLLIALFGVRIADYASLIERQTARRYEERLAWMQRLSMVGKAMAAVLHEAKTPIGTIVLNAEQAKEMLRKSGNPSAELDVIAEEADHATAILQNFLDFVKPSPLDLQPLLAHEPLTQALGMQRVRFDERGVSVKTSLLTDCRVLGSSRHLVQAFTNILNNASDAMPKGGDLGVAMERRAGSVVVRFQDTGAGLTKAALRGLFEPFATTKVGGEGHGLGLSIVRWIIQEHGGEVEVDSPGPGKGAAVVVRLPLTKEN